MTRDERALLLLIARWILRHDEVTKGGGEVIDLPLARMRDLVERLGRGDKPAAPTRQP